MVTEVKTYEGMPIPSSSGWDFLIVMGGPMSVNDPLPFLAAERQLIRAHVDAGKPMLGICLGAQQLAKAFGAKVGPAVKEVGWAPVVELATDKEYQVIHWHGEGFDLPTDAQLLYSSKDWKNQGFSLKNAVGLQFHPEVDNALLAAFVANDGDFIPGNVLGQSEDEIAGKKIPAVNKGRLFDLLDKLVG